MAPIADLDALIGRDPLFEIGVKKPLGSSELAEHLCCRVADKVGAWIAAIRWHPDPVVIRRSEIVGARGCGTVSAYPVELDAGDCGSAEDAMHDDCEGCRGWDVDGEPEVSGDWNAVHSVQADDGQVRSAGVPEGDFRTVKLKCPWFTVVRFAIRPAQSCRTGFIVGMRGTI